MFLLTTLVEVQYVLEVKGLKKLNLLIAQTFSINSTLF